MMMMTTTILFIIDYIIKLYFFSSTLSPSLASRFRRNKMRSNTEDMPIYNYVSSVENPLTWGQFTELNIQNGFDYPFSSAIWYLSFHTHKTAFMNRIYMFFLHLLPAMLIDLLSMCVGQRPRLLKVYKKIHKFSSVISFFCTNEWVS